MKKTFLAFVLCLAACCQVMAQTDNEVAESKVPARNVEDFQRQNIDSRDLHWLRIDSTSYEANFKDANGDRRGIRYTPRGTEHRYYINEKIYPHAITDSIATMFPSHKITDLTLIYSHRKYEYVARIAQKKGFLFWKKEKNVVLVKFDINGKLLDTIPQA